MFIKLCAASLICDDLAGGLQQGMGGKALAIENIILTPSKRSLAACHGRCPGTGL